MMASSRMKGSQNNPIGGTPSTPSVLSRAKSFSRPKTTTATTTTTKPLDKPARRVKSFARKPVAAATATSNSNKKIKEVIDKDKLVFIKDEKHAWVPAVRLSTGDKNARVKVPIYEDEDSIMCDNGMCAIEWKEVDVDLQDYHNHELPMQNALSEDGCSFPDMVDFEHLHEPGILYNLKSRHMVQKPYTRCGDMVISVNPFQWIKRIYTEENRAFYSKQLVWKNCDTDPRRGLEPHVYEVSALAYKGLAFEGRDQSILITGESGSGKTETTKIIMNHIASIQRGPLGEKEDSSISASTATTASVTTTSSSDASVCLPPPVLVQDDGFFSPIVQRVLESNPLLEAFGNAKTRRNDNSSRFGKYTQLQFDRGDPSLREFNLRTKALCVLAGSKCEVYLLEKNRICSHAEGERSFHIFYQLLATEDFEKERVWHGLAGKRCDDFKFIGPTSTKLIEGKTDEAKFTETVQALADIGLRGKKYVTLMRAICIVMQLGNITFEVCPNDDDRAVISSAEEFSVLSELMGISEEDLTKGLTERTMSTRGEVFKVKLKASEAREACISFAKEIYSKTFLWLVRSINDATCAELNYFDRESSEDFGVIGLLDIFGFESFKHNHFEQLCINYANEKLQQKALDDLFRATKKEYDFEGIKMSDIEYVDNEGVLKLIEGRGGLLSLLNEECHRPKGNDEVFVQKAVQEHSKSPCFIPPKKGVRNKFEIVHYAGKVEYEADRFVVSNQDSLPQDLRDCGRKCSNEIIAFHLDNENSSNPLPNNECSGAPVQIIGLNQGALDSLCDSPSKDSVDKSPCKSRSPTKMNHTTVNQFQSPSKSILKESKYSKATNRAEPFSGIKAPPLSSSDDASSVSSKAFSRRGAKRPTSKSKAGPTRTLTKSTSDMSASSRSRTSKSPIRGNLKRSVSDVSMSSLIQATVWSKYQQQLSMLMDMLSETKSRYVRCIKPNTKKKPFMMEHATTVEQLRCAGIVSTVTLYRATFANSISNGVLRFRYKNMWDIEKYPAKTDGANTKEAKFKAECEALLESAFKSYNWDKTNVKKSPYIVGKTRTYFRKGALEYLESNRVLELDASAVAVQKRIRGILDRKWVADIKIVTPRIQHWYRVTKARIRLRNLARKRRFQKSRSIFGSTNRKFTPAGSVFR